MDQRPRPVAQHATLGRVRHLPGLPHTRPHLPSLAADRALTESCWQRQAQQLARFDIATERRVLGSRAMTLRSDPRHRATQKQLMMHLDVVEDV